MTIKLGIVMDPIADIKVKKDSSLAMMLEAQQRGYEIYYMEMNDLYLMQGQANYIDTGSARNARATGDVVFERLYDNGTLLWDAIPQLFDTWPDNFDTWTDENAAFGDVNVLVYVRATPDDPAGTPTWGAWSLANGATVVGNPAKVIKS